MLDLYTLSNGKDIYLARHHTGTTFYAIGIALAAGLDTHIISILQTAGMVHDVGKIGIPLSILQKTEKLTDDEWLIIKQHAVVGAEIYTQQYRRTDKYVKEVALAVKSRQGEGCGDLLDARWASRCPEIAAVASTDAAKASDLPNHRAFSPIRKRQKATKAKMNRIAMMYSQPLVKARNSWKVNMTLSSHTLSHLAGIVGMLLQDGHPIDDPPEGEKEHRDDGDRNGELRPSGEVSVR